MSKAKEVIQKEIETLKQKIKCLREYFDELDQNHAHMQTTVAKDIAQLVAQLNALEKLLTTINKE